VHKWRKCKLAIASSTNSAIASGDLPLTELNSYDKHREKLDGEASSAELSE